MYGARRWLGAAGARQEHTDDATPSLASAGTQQIFGCFAVDPWKQEPFYYGSGEMFLFRLWPDWKLYTWSNKNSFFQLGQHNCLAVGGGYGRHPAPGGESRCRRR